jgi:ribosomal protein L35
MKTNKSYAKRIRVTKTGKVLARKKGGNHYNAKESRGKQLGRRRNMEVTMTNKSKSRFLANL